MGLETATQLVQFLKEFGIKKSLMKGSDKITVNSTGYAPAMW